MAKFKEPKITEATALSPDKFYLFTLEGVEDAPKDIVFKMCKQLNKSLEEHNIKGLFIVAPAKVKAVEVTQSEFRQEEERYGTVRGD